MINQYIYRMILTLFIANLTIAQDEFEKWRIQEEENLSNLSENETERLIAITKEFDKYAEEQDRLFSEFKDEVEKKWDAFRFSSKKIYVDYDDDLSSRGTIDFENGEVEVEVLVEKKNGSSVEDIDNIARQKLQKKIEKIVIKKGLTKNKVIALARDNLVSEK